MSVKLLGFDAGTSELAPLHGAQVADVNLVARAVPERHSRAPAHHQVVVVQGSWKVLAVEV